MLNNQPMGFYHPATLVKDAQRHGVRFAPIDVQESGWECRVEPDGRVRLGLMYVNGLRQDMGKLIVSARQRLRSERADGVDRRDAAAASESAWGWGPTRSDKSRQDAEGTRVVEARCPKCGGDDPSMIEGTAGGRWFCNICAHEWTADREQRPAERGARRSTGARRPEVIEGQTAESGRRYASIDDLVARTGVRRDELATLAEIGALNAFGHDRRSALWQIEKAVRPAGQLFAGTDDSGNGRHLSLGVGPPASASLQRGSPEPWRRRHPHSSDLETPAAKSPLKPMTPSERLMADYAGTSLTIGPHPLAMRRAELALRGVLRASDLPHGRHGRRVRIAGAVITRQRPGTAKGFVFLTLEDETGIANVIVRPDLFSEQRAEIIGEPYLIVEGTLQIQEGVTSVKADRVIGLTGGGPEPESHDFR
jgi:error-prone DNA polymerase